MAIQVHGVVVNFKIGQRIQKNNECLIKIPQIDDDSAASRYLGRRVIWLNQKGKNIAGEIVDVHGKNGVVRARFRRALPGEAIGTKVAIL